VQRKYPEKEWFIGILPRNLDVPWDRMRDSIGDKVLAECALYYDGLESLEISRRVMSAPELTVFAGTASERRELSHQELNVGGLTGS
jgi:hypothetical protein